MHSIIEDKSLLALRNSNSDIRHGLLLDFLQIELQKVPILLVAMVDVKPQRAFMGELRLLDIFNIEDNIIEIQILLWLQKLFVKDFKSNPLIDIKLYHILEGSVTGNSYE